MKILLNGKSCLVTHVAAGELTCVEREVYPLFSDANQEASAQAVPGQFQRRFRLLTETCSIDFVILVKPKRSTHFKRGGSTSEWVQRNLPRWKSETEPENIREITKTKSCSGVVVFAEATWPASYINDLPLTPDEHQLAQKALRRTTANQTLLTSNPDPVGSVKVNTSNVKPRTAGSQVAPDLKVPKISSPSDEIWFETRDGPSRRREVGPHMMKRAKIRCALGYEKNSREFRKIMDNAPHWFLTTDHRKNAGAHYDICFFKPGWKPPESGAK